jgi:trans-aconitate 2-methyltransferase
MTTHERQPKEWDAAGYDRLSDPQFAWGMRVLERLRFDGDEQILDVGCGSGRLTRELANRLHSGRVVGLDRSENMTRAASAALGDMSPVVCADALAVPFRSAFDVVFSTATFHWVLDHSLLFRSLYDVLRPGGRLEAQCGGGANLERVHARALELMASERFRRYFHDWRSPWNYAAASETTDRLRRAGFRNIRCWLEEAPTSFTEVARFREFLEKIILRSFVARLGAGVDRDAFLDTIVQHAERDDPPFTLDYWRLNISAAK